MALCSQEECGEGVEMGEEVQNKSGVGFSGFWALSHAQSALTQKREERRGNVNMEMLSASHFPAGEKKKITTLSLTKKCCVSVWQWVEGRGKREGWNLFPQIGFFFGGGGRLARFHVAYLE